MYVLLTTLIETRFSFRVLTVTLNFPQMSDEREALSQIVTLVR